MQVTLAFNDQFGVPVFDLANWLASRYSATVEIGKGERVNGIPLNTIVVSPRNSGES